MNVTTIGIDLAKSVFQLHGVDAQGEVVVRKKLRRSAVLHFLRDLPPCLIGLEACATSHFWGREIGALGHDVRLMPPVYVKPYVKRQKNDAADAEAICEAVTRPSMRFVAIKSAERQGVLMLHRTRDLLMRQRTMTLNAVRAHLAEFGLITAQGPHKLLTLIGAIRTGVMPGLPETAREALESLATQLDNFAGEIPQARTPAHDLAPRRRDQSAAQDHPRGWHHHRHSPGCQRAGPLRLQDRPPVRGLSGSGATPELIRRQRPSRPNIQDGRWLPAQASGRRRHIRRADSNTSATGAWVRCLLERKPARLVTVAVANKTARIAWAVLARGETYRAPKAA